MSYVIKGKVIKGDGYGRKIGFPTVNISRQGFMKMKYPPVFGVYSGNAILGNQKYRAGIIIGPLDKKNLPKVEAHLIGFNSNAYGKKVTLEIKKFLRKFNKFKTEKALINQIRKDLEMC